MLGLQQMAEQGLAAPPPPSADELGADEDEVAQEREKEAEALQTLDQNVEKWFLRGFRYVRE